MSPSPSAAGPPLALPTWRRGLEHALTRIAAAAAALTEIAEPAMDLGPAAEQLRQAVGSLHAAIDLRQDRLGGVHRAMAGLDEAWRALELASNHEPPAARARVLVQEARHALTDPERALSAQQAELPPETPPLRVSMDAPRLHRVERSSLLPSYKIAAPLPPPHPELPPLPRPESAAALADTMAQVEARALERRQAREASAAEREQKKQQTRLAEGPLTEVPDGFDAPVERAISEERFLRMRLRDGFEEVAMLGSQRTPQLGDPWRTVEFLERRLLSSLDAIVSLGAVGLHAIEPLVLDAPAKDPARGFAAAFVFGSVSGSDSLAAAERVVRHLGAEDPEVRAYAADALKLVPHPELAHLLQSWLRDPQACYRALALEVLIHRGQADAETLATLAHDDSDLVASLALPALAGLAPSHAELAPLLTQAQERPDRRAAAWLGMALCSHRDAITAPRAALTSEQQGAAVWALTLGADAEVAVLLHNACLAAPCPELVEAMGWLGTISAFPRLVELLEHEDEAVAAAAGAALDRMTGAGLYEEVEIAPEALIIPEVATPDVGDEAPLARQISDPRDLPAEGSPDTITRPATDPDHWRAYWGEHGPRYDRGKRYRRGHLYTPQMSLQELDSWVMTPRQRRQLQQELIVRTGRHVHFDPSQLVGRQVVALQEWEPVARAAGPSPGDWSRPARRD